ncbi:MAG: tetratricopeptide repeat protein [Acidobacteria bacterium]|nr:tetratricopeptide repeat protein [Acidobacteriota bacterium]
MRRSLRAGNKQGAASGLQGIGLVHSLNGNHRQALEAYRKNLEVAQSLGDKAELAQAYQKTGTANYNLLEYREALDDYQRALALREELGNRLKIGEAQLEVGGALGALGEFPKALEHYGKARGNFESIGYLPGVAASLLHASVIHYALNDYDKTLELAGEAAKAATLGKDLYLFWQARYREGKAHYRLMQYDRARRALSESISTIETKLADSPMSRQPRFYESTLAPYLALVDVLISQENGLEAFNIAERAKARSLLGILRSGKVWINKTMSKSELDEERRFLTQLALLDRQISRGSPARYFLPSRYHSRQLQMTMDCWRRES